MYKRPQKSVSHQLIVHSLNILDMLETDLHRRQTLTQAGKAFLKTRRLQQLSALTQDQESFVVMLIDAYASFKEAYEQAKQQRQFQKIEDPQFDLAKQLLALQEQLKIKSLVLTADDISGKYTVKLLQLKKRYSIQKQSLLMWIALAKQKLKMLQNKRIATKNIRLFTKQTSKLGFELQRSTGSYQRSQPQDSNTQSKRLKLTNKNKERVIMMEKYLQQKKIRYNRQKNKDVPEFLLSKLQEFMKFTMQKVLENASLKCRNDPKGNQFGYFESQKERVNAEGIFYVRPNIKTIKLSYPHKLALYSTLRNNELKKQNQLRSALLQEIDIDQKRANKDVQQYLLKPLDAVFQHIPNYNQALHISEIKESKPASTTLPVRTQHILYILENHRCLKNSLILFNSYHY